MNIGGPEPRKIERPAHRGAAQPGVPRSLDWQIGPLIPPVVDALMGWFGLKLAIQIVKFLMPTGVGLAGFPAVYATVLLVATFAALGLYGVPGCGPCGRLRLRSFGCILFAGFALLAALPSCGWWPSLLFAGTGGALVLLFGQCGQEALRAVLARLGFGGVTTAIIGTGENARLIAAGLLAHPEIGLRPVGFVALPDHATVGLELPLPLICRLEHAALIHPVIQVAVVATPARDRTEIEQMLGPLPFQHVALIKDMNTLHTLRLRSETPIADPKSSRQPVNDTSGTQHSATVRAIKRAVDFALTLPAVLVTLPVILILVAAVRLADPGKAIFMQQRIGYGGRLFSVYKIRTMYGDAEDRLERCLKADPKLADEWARNFKLQDDPRILPGIGHILRRFSLDELPQLWNVLLGEMSLVGPRPFPLYHLQSFDQEFQDRRTEVMPGLTGLWQITSRSDGDLSAQREQDMLYIANWSFWLDLQILLQTLPAVIRAKGAR